MLLCSVLRSQASVFTAAGQGNSVSMGFLLVDSHPNIPASYFVLSSVQTPYKIWPQGIGQYYTTPCQSALHQFSAPAFLFFVYIFRFCSSIQVRKCFTKAFIWCWGRGWGVYTFPSMCFHTWGVLSHESLQVGDAASEAQTRDWYRMSCWYCLLCVDAGTLFTVKTTLRKLKNDPVIFILLWFFHIYIYWHFEVVFDTNNQNYNLGVCFLFVLFTSGETVVGFYEQT